MTKKEEATQKLEKYNQHHIVNILEKLDEENQQKLVNQIIDMDFDQIINLYEQTKNNESKVAGKIEAIQALDKSNIKKEELERLSEIGAETIRKGKYAVVTMAGGQGTRLGFNGPKGTYKLDIGENGKYIFEILADTLKRESKELGAESNWYIMTSIENDEATKKFFEEHNFFEINKDKVKFFTQSTLPLIDKEGKLLVGKDFKVREASDGNGGVYKALKTSGMLEDMKNNGIEWVLICGVDNIMAKMADPLYVGMAIDKNVPIASKSIPKAYPEERVGVFCKRDGKPSIIEYIELSEEMRYERDGDGNLLYGDANIVNHLLRVDAIEEIASKQLDYHLAVKKNAYINEELEEIIPDEPNSYKFEAFIFDGFKFLEDMAVLRVKREEEFSPIKNKEGVDSPASAKEIYCKYWNIV